MYMYIYTYYILCTRFEGGNQKKEHQRLALVLGVLRSRLGQNFDPSLLTSSSVACGNPQKVLVSIGWV